MTLQEQIEKNNKVVEKSTPGPSVYKAEHAFHKFKKSDLAGGHAGLKAKSDRGSPLEEAMAYA